MIPKWDLCQLLAISAHNWKCCDFAFKIDFYLLALFSLIHIKILTLLLSEYLLVIRKGGCSSYILLQIAVSEKCDKTRANVNIFSFYLFTFLDFRDIWINFYQCEFLFPRQRKLSSEIHFLRNCSDFAFHHTKSNRNQNSKLFV